MAEELNSSLRVLRSGSGTLDLNRLLGKRNMAWLFGHAASLTVSLRVIQGKNFQFIRIEPVCTSQDGAVVFDFIWCKVRRSQMWRWRIHYHMIVDTDVCPAKCWSHVNVIINCVWWFFYHALEGPKLLFISKREDESLGCFSVYRISTACSGKREREREK